MPNKNAPIHTVPHGEGWANKQEGSKSYTGVSSTKAAAQEKGREKAIDLHAEHVIHNKDGKNSEKNSYGNDPKSSKG